MPDPDQGDHWDFLAADLGATPASEQAAAREHTEPPADEAELDLPEESTPQKTENADATVAPELSDAQPEKPQKRSGRKGDRVVSGFGYRRGSVDWVNLARELGVEAMEEVPAPIPASEAKIETPDLTRVEDTHIETTSQSARRDEPISTGFGAGILDSANRESTSPAADRSADLEEEQEERRGRRRRRRRKPRKAEAGEEQPAELAVREEEVSEDASSEQTDDEETGDRPRRRGRKRGGRRREPREKLAAEPMEFGAGLEAEDAAGEPFDDFDMVDDDSDEDEEDSTRKPQRHGDHSKEKRPKKITHRGIPSWEEAVGHIIDSNMDGRSKKPEPNGFRQRSGRRRGGDRSGNRGRS